MPDEYKDEDAVVAYRRYYKSKYDGGMKMEYPEGKTPYWLHIDEPKSEYTREERNSGKAKEAWSRARQIQLEYWLEWAWDNLHRFQIKHDYNNGQVPLFDIGMAFSEWKRVRGEPPTNEKWSPTRQEAKHELRIMLDHMRQNHGSHPKNIKRKLKNVKTKHITGYRYPIIEK
jgi:hypothetical protein